MAEAWLQWASAASLNVGFFGLAIGSSVRTAVRPIPRPKGRDPSTSLRVGCGAPVSAPVLDLVHTSIGRAPIHALLVSIHKQALIRTVEREGGYLDVKTLAALTLHLVSPAHHPRWRVERGATGIFEALSGL
jgi:hypothetical protein